MTVAMWTIGCGDSEQDGEPPQSGAAAVAGSESTTPCAEYADTGAPVHVGLESSSQNSRIKARLVSAEPATPEKYLNDWTVDFVASSGAPVADAMLTMARAFMPVHGHDGTFPPVVTMLGEPGRYQVDDLNLWMRGPWLIQLAVSSATAGDDYMEFSVCVEE